MDRRVTAMARTEADQPGVAACTSNPATLKAEFRDGIVLIPVTLFI